MGKKSTHRCCWVSMHAQFESFFMHEKSFKLVYRWLIMSTFDFPPFCSLPWLYDHSLQVMQEYESVNFGDIMGNKDFAHWNLLEMASM